MSNQLEEVYQNLYRIWKLEITSVDIKKIPNASCFLKDLQDLISNLNNQFTHETNQIGKLVLKKTILNIQYMLNDLLEIRAQKLLNSAKKLKNVDESFLLDIELEYYRQLFTAFKGYSKTKNFITNNENSNIIIQNENVKSEMKEFVNPNTSLLTSKNINLENNSPEINQVPINIEIQKPTLETPQNEGSSITSINNDTVPQKTENTIQTDNKKITFVVVRFLQSMPALVGEDLGIYGPFQEEDISYLPMKNAEILKEEKMAIILKDH